MNKSCQSPINNPANLESTTNITGEELTRNQLEALRKIYDDNRQGFELLSNLSNTTINDSDTNELYEIGEQNQHDNSHLDKINNSLQKKGKNFEKNTNETINQTTINSNNSSSKTRENTIPKFLTKKRRKPTGRISNEQKKKGIKGKKTDFNTDNCITKTKAAVIGTAKEVIDKEIKKKEENDIFELKRIDSSTYKNVSVKFNRELMGKTIEEIFKGKRSGLYKYFYDNNGTIEYIKEDKDKKRYGFLNYIFPKTFLQYLKLCRGSEDDEDLTEEYSVEIKEMRHIFEEKIKMKCKNKNEDYKKTLWNVINNFENIFKNKKERKSRKNENERDKKDE